MGKIKVRKFLKDSLRDKYEKGHGNGKEKGVHNETPYIHSHKTYTTYLSQCSHFADWLDTQNVRDKDVAKKLIPDYLMYLEKEKKQSPWSIYTAMSAIAKAYGMSTTDIPYEAPKRHRADVKRSRYESSMDKNFSVSNNSDLIDICSITGLRRHELEALHGNQLALDDDGVLRIYSIKGKGGRVRTVDVIGSKKEIETLKNKCKASKEGLLFPKVHKAFDEHYYRSIYACRAYKSVARPIEDIPKEDKYVCRKDKKGIIYDRKALEYASKQLGHNRVDVIALSYLHNL